MVFPLQMQITGRQLVIMVQFLEPQTEEQTGLYNIAVQQKLCKASTLQM